MSSEADEKIVRSPSSSQKIQRVRQVSNAARQLTAEGKQSGAFAGRLDAIVRLLR